MLRIFPDWLNSKIQSSYIAEYIYEIRVRVNKPIMLNYKGKYVMLTEKNNYEVLPVIATGDLISYIFAVATKQSVYAYNNQIKNGYITTDSGIIYHTVFNISI